MTIATYATIVPLPPPVTTGTTVQTYTDPNGDVWVAKNGVASGAWRRARDVIRAKANTNVQQNIPATATTYTSTYNQTVYDAYGLLNIGAGTFTAPIPGVYLAVGRVYIGFNNAGGQAYIVIMKNSSEYARAAQTAITSTAWEAEVNDQVACVAGDTLAIAYYNGTGQAGVCPAGYVSLWNFSVHLLSVN
jgi:hypothetical protein